MKDVLEIIKFHCNCFFVFGLSLGTHFEIQKQDPAHLMLLLWGCLLLAAACKCAYNHSNQVKSVKPKEMSTEKRKVSQRAPPIYLSKLRSLTLFYIFHVFDKKEKNAQKKTSDSSSKVEKWEIEASREILGFSLYCRRALYTSTFCRFCKYWHRFFWLLLVAFVAQVRLITK